MPLWIEYKYKFIADGRVGFACLIRFKWGFKCLVVDLQRNLKK